MSNDLKQKANEYLKLQLLVIPTKEDKVTALATWKPLPEPTHPKSFGAIDYLSLSKEILKRK